jgi:hypothetical protein
MVLDVPHSGLCDRTKLFTLPLKSNILVDLTWILVRWDMSDSNRVKTQEKPHGKISEKMLMHSHKAALMTIFLI